MLKAYCFILIIILGSIHCHGNGDDWVKILKEEKGVVEFYWYPSNEETEKSLNIIDGIEHDLAIAFIEFISKKYKVSIELKWLEVESFEGVLETIKNAKGGTFGASSISITEERKKFLNFTEPFMADVAVLVSNNYLPTALTEDELRRILTGNTGISIANTTLDQSLRKLQKQLGIEFEIEYETNSGKIIDRITKQTRSFGYVDIANFLDAIGQNIDVKRQFFYPVKLEGLAMIYPKGSDWQKPVEDYFNSPQFELDKFRVISKYLGSNASEIIGRISKSAEIGPLDEIVISNREKELQYERLLLAAKRDQEASRLTIILISIIVAGLAIMVLLFFLYRIKARNNDKLLSQQLLIEERNDQLRQLNDEKNNLIQVLAHDLRSPLSNILNGSQIIESNEKSLSDDGNKILGFILQSSEKMSSLIDKILDVDAIETGKHNLKVETFPVKEVISLVVEENESKAKGKSITISTSFGRKKLMVKADKVYTSQIFDNLVSNAIKYSKSDTQVKLKTSEEGDQIKISVIDHGPGLSDADKKKVFQKYQRLSAQPTKGESSIGLGLSIVKLYAERMGGTVTFESKLGKGSVFHVFLPKGK
ncbi:ATP-binding protein [Ekhidna sp.]